MDIDVDRLSQLIGVEFEHWSWPRSHLVVRQVFVKVPGDKADLVKLPGDAADPLIR